MASTNQLKSIELIQIITTFPVVILFFLISIIWNVYFVKRINYFVRLYRECVEKGKTDPTGNFSEAASHHKAEIIKYIFLLIINVTEFITMQLFTVGEGMAFIKGDFNSTTYPGCLRDLNHNSARDIQLIFATSIAPILVSTGEVCLILSLAFGVCLMKYLDVIFHNINGTPFRYIRKFLLITSLIGIFMIISGSFPQSILIEKLFVSIVLPIYFVVWVNSTRMMYKTLKWRALEFKIRGRRESIVRKSVKNSYHFALVMGILGIALGCLVLGEFIGRCNSFIQIGLHFGSCIFHYLYKAPHYEPILSRDQLKALKFSSEACTYTSTTLVMTATILIGSQYLLATVLFFGRNIVKKLKYRFGCVQTTFHPTLTRPFLNPKRAN